MNFDSSFPNTERWYQHLMKLFIFVVLISCISNQLVRADPPQVVKQVKATHSPKGWKLFWAEEFSGSHLNTQVWGPCKKGGADWNNMMADDMRGLVKVSDGKLQLRGVVNQKKNGTPYLTGGITSKGKFDFTYGKVQIRARFQSAQGAWPALWMLKSNAPWGKSGMGKIDLMEHLNFENKIYQTVHSHYTINIDKSGQPKKSKTTAIKHDLWNTYGMEWDDTKIVFTVNGKSTHTYPRVPAKGNDQYPFTEPFYFLLSMQIEGAWVGKANPKNYPANMEIDWIRIFKKDPL